VCLLVHLEGDCDQREVTAEYRDELANEQETEVTILA